MRSNLSSSGAAAASSGPSDANQNVTNNPPSITPQGHAIQSDSVLGGYMSALDAGVRTNNKKQITEALTNLVRTASVLPAIKPGHGLNILQSLLSHTVSSRMDGVMRQQFYKVLGAYSFSFSGKSEILDEAEKKLWVAELNKLLTHVGTEIENVCNNGESKPYFHAYLYHLTCSKAVAELTAGTSEIDWWGNAWHLVSIAGSFFELCESSGSELVSNILGWVLDKYNEASTKTWYDKIVLLTTCHAQISKANPNSKEFKDAVVQVRRTLTDECNSANHWAVLYACIGALETALLKMPNDSSEVNAILKTGKHTYTDKNKATVTEHLFALHGLIDYHPKSGTGFSWCFRARMIQLAINVQEKCPPGFLKGWASVLLASRRESITRQIRNKTYVSKKDFFILEEHPLAWDDYAALIREHFVEYKTQTEITIAVMSGQVTAIKRLIEKQDEKSATDLQELKVQGQQLVEGIRLHGMQLDAIDKRLDGVANKDDINTLLQKLQTQQALMDESNSKLDELIASVKRIEATTNEVRDTVNQTQEVVTETRDAAKETLNILRAQQPQTNLDTALRKLRGYYKSHNIGINKLYLSPEPETGVRPEDRTTTNYDANDKYVIRLAISPEIEGEAHVKENYEERLEDLGRDAEEQVSPANIFNKALEKKENAKHILVLGRPGIGKSTLSKFSSHQWAHGELWQDKFKGVFCIVFRNLNETRYPNRYEGYSWMDIVKKEFYESRNLDEHEYRELQAEITKGRTGLVKPFLFLLDGYDELPAVASNGYLKSAVDELINIAQINQCVITSRPAQARGARSVFCNYAADVCQFEVLGFLEEDIEQYATTFFAQHMDATRDNKARAGELISFMKRQPAIWPLAHIPLVLSMLCQLDAEDKLRLHNSNDSAKPFTLSELYKRLSGSLINKLAKLIKQTPSNHSKTLTQFEESLKKVFEHIAYKRITFDNANKLQDVKITFREIDIENAINASQQFQGSDITSVLRDCLNCGLLNRTSQNAFEFIHFTFQEYFAGRYIANAIKAGGASLSAIQPKIETNRLLPKLEVTYRFAAGHLTGDTALLTKFFDTLKPKSLWEKISGRNLVIADYERRLLVGCWTESNEPPLQIMQELFLNTLIADASNTAHVAHKALGRLEQKASLESVYVKLQQALNHRAEEVRCYAIEQLSNLTSPLKAPNLCETLYVVILNDKVSSVRLAAVSAMAKLASVEAKESYFVKLLRDAIDAGKTNDTRLNALEAVWKFSLKTANTMFCKNALKAVVGAQYPSHAMEAAMLTDAIKHEMLSNLSQTSFDRLDLSPFSSIINDAALKVVLQSIGSKLRYLSVAGCSLLSNRSLDLVVQYAANVEVFNMSEIRGLMNIADISSPMQLQLKTLILKNCKELKKIECPRAEQFPKLQTLDVSGCEKLERVEINTASMESAPGIENCERLLGRKAFQSYPWLVALSLGNDATKGDYEKIKNNIDKVRNRLAPNPWTPSLETKRSALDYFNYWSATLSQVINDTMSKVAINPAGVSVDSAKADKHRRYLLASIAETRLTPAMIRNFINNFNINGFEPRVAAYALAKTLGSLEQSLAKEVVIAMLQATNDIDEHARQFAIEELAKALGSIEQPLANEVVSAMFQATKDESEWVRGAAINELAKALGSIEQPLAHQVVSAMFQATKDKSGWVRGAAVRELAEVLGSMEQPLAHQIVTTLLQAAKDNDYHVRRAAVWALKTALGSIEQPLANEVVTAMLQATKDSYQDVIIAAVGALAKVLGSLEQPLVKEVVTAIMLQATNVTGHYAKCVVIEALGKALGSIEQPLVHQVVTAMLRVTIFNGHALVRVVVEVLGTALGSLEQPLVNEAVTALLQATKNSNKDVRNAAVEALGTAWGSMDQPLAHQAVTAMLQAAKDEGTTTDVFKALGTACGSIEQSLAHKVVTALLQETKNSNKDVRNAAVKALGTAFGSIEQPLANEVVTAMLQALQASKDNGYGRTYAVRALGTALGSIEQPLTHEVVTAITEAAKDGCIYLREAAIEALETALGSIEQPLTHEVVTAITAAAKDRDKGVRFAAVRALRTALGSIEQPLANQAVTAMLQATKDGSGSKKVKDFVIEAISRRPILDKSITTLLQKLSPPVFGSKDIDSSDIQAAKAFIVDGATIKHQFFPREVISTLLKRLNYELNIDGFEHKNLCIAIVDALISLCSIHVSQLLMMFEPDCKSPVATDDSANNEINLGAGQISQNQTCHVGSEDNKKPHSKLFFGPRPSSNNSPEIYDGAAARSGP